ncbi:glutamate-cysteine ligase family protein [Pseudohalioglobus lutimaris]|uniref:Glutamate--cysteine ligase n=1 Tax=Pseudohalioglobus lutimaris TaxID=1737061 RepID=A0A2N5WYF3_9GAMM|nr:glutamate-cysteine ligase family protein [Pseudohalioglobus lutimaris]PLW67274.1 glutamate--cysteine ligase [Pseudohalioglobus lutimaris]
MGIEIDQTEFNDQDFLAFRAGLEENMQALGDLLQRPGFGEGAGSLGAELEMYIVDNDGYPLYANQEILEDAADPSLTLELNRYNLEFNLPPFALDDNPFFSTEQTIVEGVRRLGEVAARRGGRIVPIGILPTLRETDFGSHCITDRRRYHALVKQLIERRGDRFHIDINGVEPLKLAMRDITLEGANTSFQVHYRVTPQAYADTFNAIQLMTPLAVALAANSPGLFGHSLWQETRIPLFKQSIDTRHVDPYGWNEPARVSFGQGWARAGAEELFREVVRIYPPLLPLCNGSTAAEEIAAGKVPTLAELRLHQSTVWLWNRPIYDDADGGHLRIEMRALPAGPSAVDMVANAAFLIGAAEGIRPQLNQLLPAIPFHNAEYNFYRAAQHGLEAQLVWPELDQSGFREQPITGVIERMLPVARSGLVAIGVSNAEIDRYLGVIEARLESRQSGAVWQQRKLQKLKQQMSTERALHELLENFIGLSAENLPVAQWPL